MRMSKDAKAALQNIGEDEARQMLALCVLKMLPEQWVEEMTGHVLTAIKSLTVKRGRSYCGIPLPIKEAHVLEALYADGKGEGWKPLNMIAALTEEIEKVVAK